MHNITRLLTPTLRSTYADPTQTLFWLHHNTNNHVLLTLTLTPDLRGPYAEHVSILIGDVCGGPPFVFPDEGFWANSHVTSIDSGFNSD